MSSSNQSQTLQEDPNDLLNIHTITIHEVYSNSTKQLKTANGYNSQSLIPSTVDDAAFSDDAEDTNNLKNVRKRSRIDYSAETPQEKRRREEKNRKQRENRRARRQKEQQMEQKFLKAEEEKECLRRKFQLMIPLSSFNNETNGSPGNADFDSLTEMDLDQLLTQEPKEYDMPTLPQL